MKNSIITYLLGFFFLISCFKAISNQANYFSSKLCLEVDGKISNAGQGDDGICTIELVSSNKVIATTVLKGRKNKFKFLLEKGSVYTIKISKHGYVTRLVSIDTNMDVQDEDLYKFSFETKLIKEDDLDKLNKEYLYFPIALIFYDAKKDCFVYDKEYTSKIKKEIVIQ
jgi:hypothetical protein